MKNYKNFKTTFLVCLLGLFAYNKLNAQDNFKEIMEKIPLKEYSFDGGINMKFFADANKNEQGKVTHLAYEKINGNNIMLRASLEVNREYFCVNPDELIQNLKINFEKLGKYTISNITVERSKSDYFGGKAVYIKGVFKADDKTEFIRVLSIYNLSNAVLLLDMVYPKYSITDYHKRFTVRFDDKTIALGKTNLSLKIPAHYAVNKEQTAEFYHVMPCDVAEIENVRMVIRDFSYPDDYDPDAEFDYWMGEGTDIFGFSSALDLMNAVKLEFKNDNKVSGLTDLVVNKKLINRPNELFAIQYIKKEGDKNYQITQYFLRIAKKVISASIVYPQSIASSAAEVVHKFEAILNTIDVKK
jgi:hypothetical protein